jgi:NtrC-family two-component system sensor histidine kinase KinB
LQVIVDDLLNLSRIEAGHIDLHRRRATPDALVDLAMEVHRAAAIQAEVVLRKEVPPGLPEVFVDPDRLQLVFTNLISNAIRYSPAHSEIVIRARREGTSGEPLNHRAPQAENVRFEVADSGPGIPLEHQSGLFEKFFRVPGSRREGRAWDSSSPRDWCRPMADEIGVESAAGKGTTFWFTIPIAVIAGAHAS